MSLSVELSHATALFTGVAEGDLGRTAGDASDLVVANRGALLELVGLPCITAPQQVHGIGAATARSGSGYLVGVSMADCVVTSARDVAPAVHVADCLPIVVAGAAGVGVIHAGWRGLAGGVIAAGVQALRALGVGGRLEAVIGPGAGGCCYEAGADVHDAFAGYSASHGRLLDLRAVAATQLRDAGVDAVSDVGLCTLCAPAGLLFSHRRDGAETGRQAGVAWLR